MENNSLIKVFKNATWIIIFRVIQFGLNLIISMLSAKYLGPERYGLTTYAASIASFFIPIALMGLSDTLVKELSDDPDHEGEILGSSLVISIFSSILSMAGMTSVAYLLNADDKLTILFCGLYSFSLLFQNSEIISCWFQLKLISQYPSVAALIAFAASASYRIYLLSTGKGILWFSAITVIDFGVVFVLLMIFYRFLKGPKLSFSVNTVKRLLLRSRYYILVGIVVASFSSVDKILLKQLISDEANGLYSAAFSICAATSFVYAAIIGSFRPSVIQLAKTDKTAFEGRVKTLFSIIIWISIIQNLVFSLFGGMIIERVLGEQYLEAIPVFRILTWFTTFSYLGSARNVWILSNNKYNYLWIISSIGALSGIALNWLLISSYGMIGAAISAILTQVITNFVTGFIFHDLRPVNDLMIKALSPVYIVDFIKDLIREIKNR